MAANDGTRKAILTVKELGYQLRKTGNFVKASFMVHEDTLMQFKIAAQKRGYYLQDALTEAMDLWLHSNEKKS